MLALFLTPAVAQAGTTLVQLRPHSPAAVSLRLAGGRVFAPELQLWRLDSAAAQRVVPRLRLLGLVRAAEPEPAFARTAAGDPTDPLVPAEYWRTVVGADQADPPGPGKPVTIVDSGLDITHPEFAGRPDTILLNQQTVRAIDDDHGTEVGSVVAAPENGVGVVGIYPRAVFRSWDASPNGTLSDSLAIQGILEAARQGPGVINLSFGGPEADPFLREAILLAFRAGSLVVAASGNEGEQRSPASFPADYPHVLTVGATDLSNRVASFSSVSPAVDLVAPGVSIPVAEPTFDSANGYASASGTSFSTPMVAGAAAWVWTTRSGLDNTQLFDLMRTSARDIGPPGVDNASGYGLLNVPRALTQPALAPDPTEPNDDIVQVKPDGLFGVAQPALTRPNRLTATLRARVDRVEDPRDIYRIYVPARRTLRVSASGPVALTLLRGSAQSLSTKPLASGRRSLAYRNGGRATSAYVEVRPARGGIVQYGLAVTAARR